MLLSLLQGLWMGTVPGMLLTIPYTAVQFVALQQCKDTAAKMGWEGKGYPAAHHANFPSMGMAGSLGV
jgi:predicted PurR-regulated permease PerM